MSMTHTEHILFDSRIERSIYEGRETTRSDMFPIQVRIVFPLPVARSLMLVQSCGCDSGWSRMGDSTPCIHKPMASLFRAGLLEGSLSTSANAFSGLVLSILLMELELDRRDVHRQGGRRLFRRQEPRAH